MIYMYECRQTHTIYTSYNVKTTHYSTENNVDNGAFITHHQCTDLLSFNRKCTGRPDLVFA